MRKLMTYLLTFINFGLFGLVFIVTRDLFQKILALIYQLLVDSGKSAWRISSLLHTADLILLVLLGISILVLVILIQSSYEKTRNGFELGSRCAKVSGIQLMWIGLSRIIWLMIPVGTVSDGIGIYYVIPLIAGLGAVIGGFLLKKHLLKNSLE